MTTAPAFQPQCATAIAWLADIAKKYGALTERRYRWLSAERVNDWLKNGAGRPPADYFGAQGYDSPLGTCRSATPTQRRYGAVCSGESTELGCTGAGATATKGSLDGTLGSDRRIHGWVLYNGTAYPGTIADLQCANGCVVEFDHPCSLPDTDAEPFWWRGKDGGWFATWWIGGDEAKAAWGGGQM